MTESNTSFIVAAYVITWIVILGYLFRLVVKGGHARSALARIRSGQAGESRP